MSFFCCNECTQSFFFDLWHLIPWCPFPLHLPHVMVGGADGEDLGVLHLSWEWQLLLLIGLYKTLFFVLFREMLLFSSIRLLWINVFSSPFAISTSLNRIKFDTWNYNTNRNNMWENPLSYVRLACSWLIIENKPIFWSYVKHFPIF